MRCGRCASPRSTPSAPPVVSAIAPGGCGRATPLRARWSGQSGGQTRWTRRRLEHAQPVNSGGRPAANRSGVEFFFGPATAELTGGDLVAFEGAGHLPRSRDPLKVTG